jgi:hypothetical protein
MSKLLMFGSEVEVEDETDLKCETSERLEADTPEPKEPMLIDVTAFETRFLEYCMEHGWITVAHGCGEDVEDAFYITEKGRRELARFGLTALY